MLSKYNIKLVIKSAQICNCKPARYPRNLYLEILSTFCTYIEYKCENIFWSIVFYLLGSFLLKRLKKFVYISAQYSTSVSRKRVIHVLQIPQNVRFSYFDLMKIVMSTDWNPKIFYFEKCKEQEMFFFNEVGVLKF